MDFLAAPGSLTPPSNFAAISLAAAAVCITLALLLRWKPLNRLEFLKPWLYLIAGIGFAATFMTGWVNTLLGWSRGIPIIGAAAPIVIAVVLAYIVLYDLWPKHPSNTTTEVSALLLPSFSSAIGGAVGGFLTKAISTLAVTTASVLGTAFGV